MSDTCVIEAVGAHIGSLGYDVELCDLTNLDSNWIELWIYKDQKAVVMRVWEARWWLLQVRKREKHKCLLGRPPDMTEILIDPLAPGAIESVEGFVRKVFGD